MYALNLSQQEIQIITSALGELPLKVVANVFANIQRQVSDQDAKNAIDVKQPAGAA